MTGEKNRFKDFSISDEGIDSMINDCKIKGSVSEPEKGFLKVVINDVSYKY